MLSLDNQKILLGVTGGIAAYKAAELCRLLMKQGAEVRVVMTEAAQEFIQPLTFRALTGHPVYLHLFDQNAGADNAMDHIELARWCDYLLIAPATADFLAKLANGYADNLLLTIALATENPVIVAPAMNQQMYQNAQTQVSINRLMQSGIRVWGPDSGEQACGEVGPGRMLEPQDLLTNMTATVLPGKFSGKKVMITAGPTREAIDPVRYLSNRSSGKMGYALADALSEAGAEVTLISGPVALVQRSKLDLISVNSAADMLHAVQDHLAGQDIFIGCAAVADYRVKAVQSEKIKKSDESLQLELIRNPDILATVASAKDKPFCVGFAAETSNLQEYAEGKLRRKNLDMICANRVDQSDSGFEVDENALSIYWPGGGCQLEKQSKQSLAIKLVDIISDQYRQHA